MCDTVALSSRSSRAQASAAVLPPSWDPVPFQTRLQPEAQTSSPLLSPLEKEQCSSPSVRLQQHLFHLRT